MVENGAPGRPLQRGKIRVRNDARHRLERVAARAVEVVVMSADQTNIGKMFLNLKPRSQREPLDLALADQVDQCLAKAQRW